MALGAVEVRPGFENGEQVVQHRELAENRLLLWQITEAEAGAAVHRHVRHVVAVETNRAGVRGDQAGDHVERGGLASAVRAEQADDFPGLDGDGNPVHHGAAVVGLAKSVSEEDGGFRMGAGGAGVVHRWNGGGNGHGGHGRETPNLFSLFWIRDFRPCPKLLR